MTISILFFSTLREITDGEQMSMTWDDQKSEDTLTVSDVLERLYIVYPKLREWDERVLLAVDQKYVDRESPITDGQELAVMPPVQGG